MSKALSLTPETQDLVLYAGDGASLRLTVKDKSGQPVDLTGTFAGQVKADRTTDTAIATWTIDSSSAVDGVIVISLSGDDTGALTTGHDFVGVWDIQWTPTGGEPITLLAGKLTCKPDVTRP